MSGFPLHSRQQQQQQRRRRQEEQRRGPRRRRQAEAAGSNQSRHNNNNKRGCCCHAMLVSWPTWLRVKRCVFCWLLFVCALAFVSCCRLGYGVRACVCAAIRVRARVNFFAFVCVCACVRACRARDAYHNTELIWQKLCLRTLNYLYGLAAGMWILSPEVRRAYARTYQHGTHKHGTNCGSQPRLFAVFLLSVERWPAVRLVLGEWCGAVSRQCSLRVVSWWCVCVAWWNHSGWCSAPRTAVPAPTTRPL